MSHAISSITRKLDDNQGPHNMDIMYVQFRLIISTSAVLTNSNTTISTLLKLFGNYSIISHHIQNK